MECKRETSIENGKENTKKKKETGREMKFMAQLCTRYSSFVILFSSHNNSMK